MAPQISGQAAGKVACMAIEDKTDVAKVNISILQSKLEKDDIMVHFPDEYVPEDKTVIIHGKNTSKIDGGHL